MSLVVDGTIQSIPPIFRQAVTNSSVNEIVLASSRYVLRPSSWAVFSQQEPYRLRRNLTIRGDPDVSFCGGGPVCGALQALDVVGGQTLQGHLPALLL